MDMAVSLAIAFVPLSLLAATLLRRFIDPRARWLSTGAGVACVLIGLAGAWAVIGDVRDGVVHLRARSSAALPVGATRPAWVFWDEVLLLYLLSLLMAGAGWVAMALSWQPRRR